MKILVTGGAGSGKSEFAEQYICENAGPGQKYYIATMKCPDEESLRKVERHRKMRQGKGFITVEQPACIEGALLNMEGRENAVLLECVSNLTANEMFPDNAAVSGNTDIRQKEDITDRIVKGIRKIGERCGLLVLVSNNIFEDGIIYTDGTGEYIKTLGNINRQLGRAADLVVEVVCGIPVVIKGEA